ncbi:MAG: transcriptional repressor [Deltaproteobacteria bacterium]|nr:transcriptional repressor [Deltaproteobacteria bacterium]
MQKIIHRYKGKGFKMTPQRLAILTFLEGNKTHPTAEEIFSEIKKAHPTVSFATVYNTVEALCKRGEVAEVTIDPERKHFDPDPSPHHHVMCTNCRKIGDIFKDYSATLNLPDKVRREFTITGNHVDFYGICKDCGK